MNRPFALAVLSAALAAPVAATASPKHLAIQVAVPGLSISYAAPGFGVALPAHPATPGYATVYAPGYGYAPPVHRPVIAYPVAAPVYRHGPPVVIHPRHHGHPHYRHWDRQGWGGHPDHWR